MDERFLKAVEEVLENEKGYVNDPDDPGGETKFGISKRAYPNIDIANLTKEDAVGIYYRDWWERFRYGEISDLEIATELLDIAVTNPKAAHMALQQAVKDTGGDWLDVDGYIGPITIAAVNNHPNSKWLLDRFRLLAIQHYLGCKRKFLAGQVKRALN
ncbi:MAG: peptidoglycan-binding protein [Deltaproteobacteria bacterium HGW-Deltaproteobacteria-15]|jgi:lysozyme family protein|nr:MAG: peptidoglycan-binding protein [Deltaproteobacteria bacterium HGW-Deltaproteobacteria-15]